MTARESAASAARENLAGHLRLLAGVMRRFPNGVSGARRTWRWIYQRIGGGGFTEMPDLDQRWPRGLQEPIRGRAHGMLMRLDLQDWAERRAYFSGCYYQHDVDTLLTALLRPGDQFLDVGANIGMITLTAAAQVGREGVVLAFEPNPEAAERLEDHVALNALSYVQVLRVGAGDKEGQGTLYVPRVHSGKSTLTKIGSSLGGIVVPIVPVDRYATQLRTVRPVFVKLDVEGFELSALRGMSRLLREYDVALVVEVTDAFLRRIGHSAAELHRLLGSFGFDAYSFRLESRRGVRRLVVEPLAELPLRLQYDALFVRRHGEFRKRLECVPGYVCAGQRRWRGMTRC